MSLIQFFYNNSNPHLTQRRVLKLFLSQIFKKEKRALEKLTYIFCTDEYLLSINQSFLKHDFFTDIITFDLSEKNHKCVGEIYISVDRVRDNAKKMQCSFKEEIHRVIFHGALHLCGYKDKIKQDQAKMREKENGYLVQYFNK